MSRLTCGPSLSKAVLSLEHKPAKRLSVWHPVGCCQYLGQAGTALLHGPLACPRWVQMGVRKSGDARIIAVRIIIPPSRWETVLSMTTSRCTSACSVEHASSASSHTSGVRTFQMLTERTPFKTLAMRTCCWEQQQGQHGQHCGGTELCHSGPRLQCGILTGLPTPFVGFADACS